MLCTPMVLEFATKRTIFMATVVLTPILLKSVVKRTIIRVNIVLKIDKKNRRETCSQRGGVVGGKMKSAYSGGKRGSFNFSGPVIPQSIPKL